MKQIIIRLFCYSWRSFVYDIVKNQVLKTQTPVDDVLLEAIDRTLTELCQMNENGELK